MCEFGSGGNRQKGLDWQRFKNKTGHITNVNLNKKRVQEKESIGIKLEGKTDEEGSEMRMA